MTEREGNTKQLARPAARRQPQSSAPAPLGGPAARILMLQRLAGNAAVGQLLRAAATSGPTGPAAPASAVVQRDAAAGVLPGTTPDLSDPEEIKKEIRLAETAGDSALREKAEKDVLAGADLVKVLLSSHQFTASVTERLVYARYFLKAFDVESAKWGGETDIRDMTSRLVEVEVAYQREHNRKPTAKELEEMKARGDRARKEYQENAIRQELAKLEKQEHFARFPGKVDNRLYPKMTVTAALPLSNPVVLGVIDMLIYFIPVVGEARMIVEGISGYNLITEEKLSLFNRLLSALPLAPLAIRGGVAVIGGISVTVSKASEKAALILAISQRANKGPEEVLVLMSKLDDAAGGMDALRSARQAVAEGRPLNSTELDAIKKVDEAYGNTGKTLSAEEKAAGKGEPGHRPKAPEGKATAGESGDIDGIKGTDPASSSGEGPVVCQRACTPLTTIDRARRAQYKKSAEALDNGVSHDGHSFKDHGAQTTPAQHERRLKTGVTPGGDTRAIPASSGKFATHSAQMSAYERATNELAANYLTTGTSPRMKLEYTAVFDMPGAGFSYSLDASGNVVRTTVGRVSAYFRLNSAGWYDLVTMYPRP